MKIFSSYRFKFLFFVVLFILILTAVISLVAVKLIEKNTADVYYGVVKAAIRDVQTFVDTEKIAELAVSLDSEDEYYINTCVAFNYVRQTHGCSYIYVMVPTSENSKEFMYVLDGCLGYENGYLKEEEDNLKDQLKYYFYKFQGMFEYELNNIDQSIKFMNMALLVGKDIYLPEWEQADINYMISLCYLADENLINCIMYINEALTYFQTNFKFKRVIECYIVLGIASMKAYMFDKANETLMLALKLTDEVNITSYKPIIYHNIGSLYAMNHSKDSIKYFKMSFEHMPDITKKLESIFCIMKEYLKSKEWQLVKEWTEKGLHLILEEDNTALHQNYSFHFSIYHAISTKGYAPIEQLEEAIKYFNETKDFKYCTKYSNLLGKFFYKQGKYKLAASYFEEANNYILKEKKLSFWEDL